MTTALVGYYDWDTIRLRYKANAAPASLNAYVLYEFDSQPGVAYRDEIPEIRSFTTTWSEQTLEADPATGGGIPTGHGCKVSGGGVQIRSSATSLVKGSMYVRLLIARQNTAYEECLCCGYVYDNKPFLSIGEHTDLEMSEALASMSATWQQANAAGGLVRIDIVPGAGSAFQVVWARATNSGTNTLIIQTQTATGAGELVPLLASIASGAATVATVPQTNSQAATSSSLMDSTDPSARTVSGTQSFVVRQTGAGAQNDTLQLIMLIRVKGALPTVSKANSTNEADVTVSAGAASFAFIS